MLLTRRPTFRWFAWAVVWACLASPALSQRTYTEAETERLVSQWREALSETDAHLKAARWRQADRNVRLLIKEIVTFVVSGKGATELLGRAVAYRALATAGLGDLEAAEWDWDVAMNLLPSLAESDLAAYGEVGEGLRDAFDRHHGTRRTAAAEPVDGPDHAEPAKVIAPKRLRAPKPRYPRAKHFGCVEAAVKTSVIVGSDGTPRHPSFEPSNDPVLAFAATESLREWTFEPATQNGQPVAVFYNLTVNFRAPHCGRR